MAKLEEETTNGNDKPKNNKIEKVEISVIFEKDRHPSFSKSMLNMKKIDELKLNMNNIEKYKDEYPSEIISSKRDFTGTNNKIENLNNM